MPRTTDEVLVGAGTLYTAPTGTAYPADPTVAPSGTWIDIGYSEEGWRFTFERTTENVEVEEELDPVDIAATANEGHFVGVSAQSSLENLKLAFGGGTITVVAGPPARKEYVPPASDVMTRYALLFRGAAPKVAGAAKTREVQIPYAIPVGAVEIPFRKAPNKQVIAMDFRMVKVTGTNLFKVIDLT